MPLGVELVVRGVFNRARRGLYAGKYIRFGNNVSEDGHNKYDCARWGLCVRVGGALWVFEA